MARGLSDSCPTWRSRRKRKVPLSRAKCPIEARIGLDELIETQPTNGTAYLKRGAAHYYLNDHAAAETDWHQATWLLPEDPTPLENLEVLRDLRENDG